MKNQSTNKESYTASVRLMLAVIFLMTGPMKLLIPSLGEAWSGQLIAARLPLYEITYWGVPFLEIILGIVLMIGIFTRPASLVIIGIMVVATYVHIVVDDPALFPLQPDEPIIPIAVIAMSIVTLWRGAGAWSLDLKSIQDFDPLKEPSV
jgi:uncharacterized membrane protein YphA (DoxX/SURF4 family)